MHPFIQLTSTTLCFIDEFAQLNQAFFVCLNYCAFAYQRTKIKHILYECL